jgi:hypothetical protein
LYKEITMSSFQFKTVSQSSYSVGMLTTKVVPIPGTAAKLSIREQIQSPGFWLSHRTNASPVIHVKDTINSADFESIRLRSVAEARKHEARLNDMGFSLVEEMVTGPCGAGKVEKQSVLRFKYDKDFKIPTLTAKLADGTELSVEMVLVRHGSTDGGPTTEAKFEERIQQVNDSNLSKTEKEERIAYIRELQTQYKVSGYHEHAEDDRVFQGNVDAVTNNSDATARKAAALVQTRVQSELIAKGWTPDLVVSSPLGRAMQVVGPTIETLPESVPAFTDVNLVEVSFGALDGRLVEGIGTNHPEDTRPAHPIRLFNLEDVSVTGVVLDHSTPLIDGNGHLKKGESMVECLLRADTVLSPDYLGKWVSENLSASQIEACKANGKVRILAAGHSMIFASMMMKMGCAYTLSASQDSNGSTEDPIGFDGKSIHGRALRLEHATPTAITPIISEDGRVIMQPQRPVGFAV